MKIMAATLVFLGTLVSVFFFISRPKTENFSFNSSSDLKITMNLQKGTVIFYSGTTNEPKGVISYSGNKPQILNTDRELNISDASSVVKNIEIAQPDNFQANSIVINIGAGNVTLPLRSSEISNVEVNAGASNIKITVPGNVSSNIKLTIGAGNLHVTVPETDKLNGVRIKPMPGTTFTSSNFTGFKKVGDDYETENFDETKVTATIYVSAGSANFSIDSVE